MALGGGLGAASGALAGKLSDCGIPDDFIKQLGGTIKPNSSALFLLVQKVTADKVLPRMTEFRGRVLRTSLSDEREKRLRERWATRRQARPEGGAVPAARLKRQNPGRRHEYATRQGR